jgi:hypothetical protein
MAASRACPPVALGFCRQADRFILKRWDRFARFIDDGRICLTNNAAERALRGFALGRKSWLFAGSERGADRAAVMATLIMTAKLNDVDHCMARRRALPYCRPAAKPPPGTAAVALGGGDGAS